MWQNVILWCVGDVVKQFAFHVDVFVLMIKSHPHFF